MIRQVDPLISFPATDVARAVRFYTEVLGCEVALEVPDAFYVFRLPEGSQFLGVHAHDGPLPPVAQQGTWIWLRVDAIAPVRERFAAQGVRLLGEPRDLGPGWEQLFLDSEGNVLRLYEALDVVERSVEIAAPAEAVWGALTQAGAIERWFDAIDDVTFEARAGGRVAFRDPAFGEVEGTITAWEPVTRLAVEFRQNWPRLLEYRLTPVAGGTRVEVTQRDFAPIHDRDFGIPGMIEHLEQALALLATLAKAGAFAVSAVDLARTVREQLKTPQ